MLSALVLAALMPACDFTIRTAADWRHVNDSNKRVICVAAGTYRWEDVGVITLTASGTSDRPRYLRWAQSNESLHPANAAASSTAVLHQFVLKGSHWIIDRLVIKNGLFSSHLTAGAHDNVLRGLLIEAPRPDPTGKRNGLMFEFRNSHNNVIERSVFRNGLKIRGKDSYAIYINESFNETIRDNEFINMANGISVSPLAGGGHRIENNEFYQTPANYTDCRGSFSSTGACMCGEGMAFVAKGPKDQAQIYVERNLAWGYKPTDQYCSGTGSDGMVFNLGSGDHLVRNISLRGNIITESPTQSIIMGRFVEDVAIAGNYLANAVAAIQNGYGKRVSVVGNVYNKNRLDFFTTPYAVGGIVAFNRQAGTGQLCFTKRHLTNPTRVCVPG